MDYEYIVIGGGISGMSTAAILASHGHSVALVEKGDRLAPTIRGFRRNGLYFDSGFHYAGALGEGELLRQMLDALDVSRYLLQKPLDDDAFDCIRLLESGIDFDFCCGWERLQQRLAEACPGEEKAIEQYLDTVRNTFETYPRALLTGGLDFGLMLGKLQSQSLESYLDEINANELLKTILTAHGLLYGVKPEDVSFAYHAAVVGSYYQSAYTFEGGGGAILEAFEKRLAQLGVDIFLKHDVNELAFSESGELQEARIEGGSSIRGRACVSTIHPHLLIEMVPKTFLRPAYRHRVSAMEDTPSAWVLYIDSRNSSSTPRNGNLFLMPGTGTQSLAPSTPIAQRPLFVAPACGERDPSRRALSAICMARYEEVAQWEGSSLGNRPDAYVVHKREVMEIIRQRVQSDASEWVGEIEWTDGASPLTFRDYMNSPRGSLYGISHRADQIGLPPRTKLPSLFLSGQAVLGPGLLGTILSAFYTCGTILGFDVTSKDLGECA